MKMKKLTESIEEYKIKKQMVTNLEECINVLRSEVKTDMDGNITAFPLITITPYFPDREQVKILDDNIKYFKDEFMQLLLKKADELRADLNAMEV